MTVPELVTQREQALKQNVKPLQQLSAENQDVIDLVEAVMNLVAAEHIIRPWRYVPGN